MLMDYNTTILLPCSSCGDLCSQSLSIFSIRVSKTQHIICDCSHVLATVGIKKEGDYWLCLYCLPCSTHHLFFYSQGEFYSDDIIPIQCPESGMTRGYLGPKSLLRDRTFHDRLPLSPTMDFFHYFHDPETMLAVLDIIHDIAAAGRLFCHCGGHEMDITLYPDQLELNCRSCSGLVMLNAATQDSLLSLRRLKCLLLPEQLEESYDPDGFSC